MSNDTNYPDEQPSVFSDALDLSESNKKIRGARTYLYAICILQVLAGVFEYTTTEDRTIGAIAFGIDAFIACIFLALALITMRKPFLALLSGLIIYVLFTVVFCVLDPANVGRGIIMKLFIAIALVKGIQAAREAEQLRKIAGESQPPRV